MEEFEVAVIGAGLAGARAARGLARAGIRVALVESKDTLSELRPCHPTRLAGVQEPPFRTARALGAKAGAVFALAGADGPGAWWLADAREADTLALSAAALQEAGHPAQRVAPPFGDGFVGALFCPLAGALPEDASLRWASAALAAGACFRGGRRVERLRRLEDGVALEGADLRAQVVVLANGHAAAALDPFLEGALTPVREVALLLEGALPGAARWGQGWCAAAPVRAGVELTGARWATPHLEIGETDPQPSARVVERLKALAARHLPEHPVTDQARAWIAAHTCDGLPLVGPLPGDGAVWALVGFGSTAPSLAPLLADHLVAQLLGQADPNPGWGPVVEDLTRPWRLVR